MLGEHRTNTADSVQSDDRRAEVLRTPYVTVAEAQRVLGVTNPTARTAVNALVSAGLLEEVGDRKWRRLHVARPVLDVLLAPMEAM